MINGALDTKGVHCELQGSAIGANNGHNSTHKRFQYNYEATEVVLVDNSKKPLNITLHSSKNFVQTIFNVTLRITLYYGFKSRLKQAVLSKSSAIVKTVQLSKNKLCDDDIVIYVNTTSRVPAFRWITKTFRAKTNDQEKTEKELKTAQVRGSSRNCIPSVTMLSKRPPKAGRLAGMDACADDELVLPPSQHSISPTPPGVEFSLWNIIPTMFLNQTLTNATQNMIS
eukprot:3482247-Amphidinium_carterae.1